MPRYRFSYLLVIILFAQASTGSSAVTAEQTKDLVSLSLEELLSVKVEVATKTHETATQAPASVTVYTRREIEALGVMYLEDLLNLVPGFQSTFNQDEASGFNRISVRGRSSNNSSRDVFLFADTYPDLAIWAATQTALDSDAASELEDMFNEVSTCTENRLWKFEPTR